jgi:hypothetical protein
MIVLTSWQPHAHCRWCERNGGWPLADFGEGFLRDVPLCFGCLTRAMSIRVRESSKDDADAIVLSLPADIAEAALRRCGFTPLPAGLRLKAQQPHTRLAPRCSFCLVQGTQLTVSAAAVSQYGIGLILVCLSHLQGEAAACGGLSAVQVFVAPAKAEPLWFIEDDTDGSITVLLPSDY